MGVKLPIITGREERKAVYCSMQQADGGFSVWEWMNQCNGFHSIAKTFPLITSNGKKKGRDQVIHTNLFSFST